MQVSEQGLALIRRFEGFSATPYRCPAGKMTIGYGHVITVGEKFPPEGISQEQAEDLLQQDASRAAAAVTRYVRRELEQHQFDALACFVFNVGGAAFARSTLRRVVNLGWHGEAPSQFARWVYTGGNIISGLVARRAAEAAMYEGRYAP